MGCFGYRERNARGERVIEYAHEHKMSIMKTYFKKKNSKRWTWISPDQNTKNEIDLILSNNPKSVTNIEVLNNIKFPSDHRLLRATIMLQNNKKSRKNFRKTITLPKSDKEINNYCRNLEQHATKINIPDKENVQIYYNKIEDAIIKSLQSENIRIEKTHRIFSENTKELINRRTELIHTKNKTTEKKKDLSNLFKQTNKAIKRDYSEYRKNIIIRNMRLFRSTKKANKEMNLHKNWIQNLGKNTEIIKTRKDILDTATKFYQELYTKQQDSTDSDSEDSRH